MKKAFLIAFLGSISLSLFAQQHGIYSQYIFNLYTINPAYAGERDALSAALSYRAQWVGFEGAPKTQNFSIHSPLPNNNMAVGLIVQNDEIGARSAPSLMLTYAYKFQVSREAHISLGLQAGAIDYQYHWDELNYRQSLDPVAFGTDQDRLIPNIDFGAMYLRPKAYIGLSIMGLYNAKLISSDASDARLNSVVNLVAGKMYRIAPTVFLMPSTLVRKSIGGPTQFDLNIGALYKNRYWITATYRYQFGAVLAAHIYVNDNFHFGYAYDLPLNNLLSEQSGTHELFIGYDFNLFKKQNTPQFF